MNIYFPGAIEKLNSASAFCDKYDAFALTLRQTLVAVEATTPYVPECHVVFQGVQLFEDFIRQIELNFSKLYTKEKVRFNYL